MRRPIPAPMEQRFLSRWGLSVLSPKFATYFRCGADAFVRGGLSKTLKTEADEASAAVRGTAPHTLV